MVTKCPVCKKRTVVLYPDLWAYKRKGIYYCTWHCLRVQERKEDEKMAGKQAISEEQRMHAVQLAINGENPFPYLAECGSTNPKMYWGWMKGEIKKKDPELYAKIPDLRNVKPKEKTISAAEAMQGMQDAADEFFGKCEDMGLMKKAEPEPVISKPVNYEGLLVREVEGTFDRYRRSDVNDRTYIDFENADRLDTLSLTVEQWRSFREEQEKAAAILGVTL